MRTLKLLIPMGVLAVTSVFAVWTASNASSHSQIGNPLRRTTAIGELAAASSTSADVWSANQTRESALRGGALFHSERLECINCHTIETHEMSSGPSLSAIGARLSRQQIASAIRNPSQAFARGYKQVTVMLQDGRDLTGVEQEQESTIETLVLKDRNGQTLLVSRIEIEHQKVADSDMPSGQGDHLSDQEFTDLVSYLASLRPANIDSAN